MDGEIVLGQVRHGLDSRGASGYQGGRKLD
ncbi:UNVERIFIED_ORG: hypothetical protein BDU10_4029 [Burkholderia sp. CF145]|jgi:hypothetical protein|nr:hypothetical protein SAMN06266956_2464 [Paraburkholderia hospita]